MTAIVVMALVTIAIRLSGLGAAHWLSRWPAAEMALTNAGPSLMGAYLLIQIAIMPTLLLPVAVTMAVVWRFGGLQLAFLAGWLALMAVRHL
ncbi:hypothetical protein DBV14_27645 [Variovorax sp. KBW07]|uniref:hypothetical protein n=1 Tax=Variovorax sp. KBW07 TaxID=2153358 RepID=UPI000F55A2B8|nr:hypothetical protein [Variovorax sp. KBW07]RQO42277.1 hypothetical protein DBV14_27645 [Variovorax sp. KBW07]